MAEDNLLSNRLIDLEESVDFLLEARGGDLATTLKAWLASNDTPRRVLAAFETGDPQERLAHEAGVKQPAVSKALKRLERKRLLAREVDSQDRKTGRYRITKVTKIFRLQEYARELE